MNSPAKKDDAEFNIPTLRYTEKYDLVMVKGAFTTDEYHQDQMTLFYKAVHHLNVKNRLTVYLHFESVEVGTVKFILDLFRQLSVLSRQSKTINIHWLYSTDRPLIKEIGLQLKALYDLNIQIDEA